MIEGFITTTELCVLFAAQPVFRGLLQPSHTFAQHVEGCYQFSVPIREDFGRGLWDSGVHIDVVHVGVVTEGCVGEFMRVAKVKRMIALSL